MKAIVTGGAGFFGTADKLGYAPRDLETGLKAMLAATARTEVEP